MSKISAVIIVRNGENIIADCIDSLSFCDEIVVVNNDSTDRTEDVVKMLKGEVYKFSSENFSELRNFGLKKAKND